MSAEVLAIPDHLRDALWRVESARLEPSRSAGVVVCGMGGSAIGGDLAAAALGGRLSRPMLTVRGYELPSWVDSEWTVLCSSYSGETEETISCFDAATAVGARRIVASTGGALVERARDDGVPVIGLPGILQPREAVAYMFTTAAEVAALAGAAPSPRAEIEATAELLDGLADDLGERAAEIAGRLAGTVPVVCGAGLTAPVARRWKTQINENAKLLSFFTELPESDHNEICGWAELPEGSRFSVVMLQDPGQSDRMRRRFELTAAAIEPGGTGVVAVEAEGQTGSDRLLWAVMLGDLVSLELAAAHGVEPGPVPAIDALKESLARS